MMMSRRIKVMGKEKYRLQEKNGSEMHPQRESMCQSGKTLTLTNAARIVTGCLSCLHNDHVKHPLVSRILKLTNRIGFELYSSFCVCLRDVMD
ncbi:hypothetical protein Pcinc_019177 [Petrolisthes cinctipes]|uniref:Uncharacterized protein n=1 Tax=Petrolisthes cinctipes TaxID=88211 RepID=A0AAE1FLY8_PETCI|nr:hypothetical protein Pcinc_019177 [Petrolisthes cinctipes]